MEIIELFPEEIGEKLLEIFNLCDDAELKELYGLNFVDDDLSSVEHFGKLKKEEQNLVIQEVQREMISDSRLVDLDEQEPEFAEKMGKEHPEWSNTTMRCAWNDEIESMLQSKQIADEQIYL